MTRRIRLAIAKNKSAGAGYLLPDGRAGRTIAPTSLLLATFAIAWFAAHFIGAAA